MCSKKTTYTGLAIAFAVFMLSTATRAQAQYNYRQQPLITIIKDIQQKTTYRFLYRESLVSNVKLSFSSDEKTLFNHLGSNLKTHGIDMKVDSSRSQVLIYKSANSPSAKPNNIRISGYIVDASSGERLPYATISWKHNGHLKGTTSNSAGYFTFQETTHMNDFPIKASYVGYSSQSVDLDIRNQNEVKEVTIRLRPELVGSGEIVVTGQNYYASHDSATYSYIDIGTFSPLGESNSIRALQMLPSVGLNPALSSGINVRGSSSDGFRVLLDGITIYNQSHLFGLLDSFNSDALHRSGMFYGITPAQFQGPPGGTLMLKTRNGSLNRIHSSVGFSNSTVKATLEGPFREGRSSWLVSGRHSYMNTVNWLNNKELVGWGLDINRNREVLADGFSDLQSNIIDPGNFEARFFDIHSKLRFEGKRGNRFILSAYYGGDLTDQTASRKSLRLNFAENPDELEDEDVKTKNEWGNFSSSIEYEASLSDRVFSRTSAAVSVYETDFSKDDFTYSRFRETGGVVNTLVFVQPFANKSILNEIKGEQQFDISFKNVMWTIGATYQYYLNEYFEESFDRSAFFINSTTHKIDGYTQFDIHVLPDVQLNLGSRMHYYSDGSYLRWSPRTKLELFPERVVSLSAGYSRNYQFLHQINLDNVITSDVWILSNKNQPPGEVDYITTGVYIKPSRYFYLQTEGYLKYFENLRLHEINTQTLTNTFSEAPWFFDNDGYGRGVEVMLRNNFDYFTLTQTFALSKMEMNNPLINEGESFPVDWDRTYRYTTSVEIRPVNHFSLFVSWLYATGTPNKLAVFGNDEQERLGDYQRTDLTLEYKNRLDFGYIDLSLSIYNLFDRLNPWYRENSFILDRSGSRPRLRDVPVNVYDLGFQPSFEISVTF